MLNRRDAAIVGAFTGVLCGPFSDIHKYAEEKLGRPIFTHEFGFGNTAEQLKEAAREDFLAICATEGSEGGV